MKEKLVSLELTENEESRRLGSYSPLKTLGMLALGPILSEIGSSLYGVIDGIWVGKTLGKAGMSAEGSIFALQYISRGFSSLILVSVNSKLGYLYAQKNSSEIPIVLLDIFRFTILLGILAPLILLPFAHPILSLIGISQTNQKNGFLYLLPMLSCYVVTGIFQFLTAILQANGYSLYYGFAQLSVNLIDMFIFDPLFLLYFKTNIWGSSLSTILSQLIVLIVIFVIFYRKKIIHIPEKYNWFGLFSKESRSALKVGFSAFITQLAMTLPAILIQKYLSLSSKRIGASTEVMGVWHIMGRVYHIVEMVMTAISRSFIPAASFAFGSMRGKRFFKLTFHILWIGTTWAAICSFAFAVFPEQICSIWSPDPAFNYYLKKMIPLNVYTAALMPTRAAVSAVLQSMKRGNEASLLNFLAQLVASPIYSSILYFTKNDDPIRIVWCYVFSDSTAFLLSLFFAISPYKTIKSFLA